MQSASTLFLSAEPCASPGDYTVVTFAAVHVDAELSERLLLIARLCKKHKFAWLRVQHTGKAIFWDTPPGSRLEDCIVEYSEWQVDAHHASLILWGREMQPEGGFSSVTPLACSWIQDIEELRSLSEQGFDFEYREVDDWEEKTGVPFAVAVHDRLADLRAERMHRERSAK